MRAVCFSSRSESCGAGEVCKELLRLANERVARRPPRAVRNAAAALLRLGIVQEQIRHRAVAGRHVRGDALGASLLAGGCHEGIHSASGGEQPPPQLGAERRVP